jgi:predicted nucleotidyltransferase
MEQTKLFDHWPAMVRPLQPVFLKPDNDYHKRLFFLSKTPLEFDWISLTMSEFNRRDTELPLLLVSNYSQA